MIASQTEIVGELTIDELRFETGKTDVSAPDKARLKDVGERLKGLPLYLLLEAFTDAVGDELKNQKLSEARAAAAAAAIADGGFSVNQLVVIGYGKQFSKGRTEGEKAAERRVAFTVLRQKSRPELQRKLVEEVRARGLKLVERGPTPETGPAPLPESPSPAPPRPRPLSVLFGLASGPNLLSTQKLSSSRPRTGLSLGVNVWRWSDESALRVDASAQNATARDGTVSGTLSRLFAGIGVDHVWWGQVFGGLASSLTGGAASYSFNPSSLDEGVTAEGWTSVAPGIQAFLYGFGFHPKMRLGAFSGLGITADSLAISPEFVLGATYSW